MCGRYAASASADLLVETFEVDVVAPTPQLDWMSPRYNVAPTDPVPAILERVDKETGDVVRRLTPLRWGLVPSWSKSASGPARMINARAETVAEKPAFRKPFASRRCLLPADGYYEWYTLTDQTGAASGRPRKQPFFIHPVSAPGEPSLLVMAGIYDFWRDPSLPPDDDAAWVVSCSILTTTATDALGHIHDRMPVQVRRGDWDAWLDPSLTDPDAIRGLMHVPGPDEMVAHAVSTRVNKVGNDGPDLISPLEEDA